MRRHIYLGRPHEPIRLWLMERGAIATTTFDMNMTRFTPSEIGGFIEQMERVTKAIVVSGQIFSGGLKIKWRKPLFRRMRQLV